MKSQRCCCCRHYSYCCLITLLCILASSVSTIHGLALPSRPLLSLLRTVKTPGGLWSVDSNSRRTTYLENLDDLSGKKFRRKQVVQNIIEGSDEVVAKVASQEFR
jgi:hypothetical protein